MNIGFIERLKEQVSSTIFNKDTEYVSEKYEAIGCFLPVLLSMLRGKPEWLESLTHQLNPLISEVFARNFVLKQQLLNEFGGIIPSDQIEHTLNQCIAPTLTFLQTEVDSSDSQAIMHLLETHAVSIKQALPVWAESILAPLGISLSVHPFVYQQPIPLTSFTEEEKKKGFWLPFIIFLTLAVIALVCIYIISR